MIKFNHIVTAWMMVVLGGACASAEKNVCSGTDVLVRVEVGKMVDIYVEEGIADLVRSGDPSTVKVEHTSGHIFLTPLAAAPADITILDAVGRSHRIKYVFDQGVDEKIVVGDCREQEAGTDKDLVMSMVRDLIRGRQPEGSRRREGGPVIFEDAQVRMTLVVMHELPKLAGYVVTAENLTDGPAALPLQRIAYPGLLAVAADKESLEARAQANVYMVVAR